MLIYWFKIIKIVWSCDNLNHVKNYLIIIYSINLFYVGEILIKFENSSKIDFFHL